MSKYVIPPEIEITIPVLNERVTLERQVRIVRGFLDAQLADMGPVGLVIADNGSSDGTSEIARSLAADLPYVRLVQLGERGVGRALKASWGSSEAQVIGYMDLDLATDLQHLRGALALLLRDEAEVVTGSRLEKGAQVVGRTLKREITSRVFNLILKAFFGTKFSDGMCGFKFLKREVLPELRRAGAVSEGWFFATELLVTAEYLGYRVVSLPVKWTDDVESKVKIGRLMVEYLKAMWALRRRLDGKR